MPKTELECRTNDCITAYGVVSTQDREVHGVDDHDGDRQDLPDDHDSDDDHDYGDDDTVDDKTTLKIN